MVAKNDGGKRFTATLNADVFCACAARCMIFSIAPYTVLANNHICLNHTSVTSRAVDIIPSFIISTALDVTEVIFAVLYVSIMGLTRFDKTTVFCIYFY